MKKWLLVFLVPVFLSCESGLEINNIETVRDKILRLKNNETDELTKKLVVSADGMDGVTVANITFKKGLTCDIYYPPDFQPAPESGSEADFLPVSAEVDRIPFVVFPTSFTIEGFKTQDERSWKDQDSNISWACLLAVNGIGSVFYNPTSITEDLDDLMTFLYEHGSDLGLDRDRIGVLAFSGNGRVGIRLALDARPEYAPGIRAAAFFHANLRAGAIARKDVPFYLVYTEHSGTEFEGLMKAFIKRGLRAGLDITERKDAPYKNFQYDDESPVSKEIINGLIDFMVQHLQP